MDIKLSFSTHSLCSYLNVFLVQLSSLAAFVFIFYPQKRLSITKIIRSIYPKNAYNLYVYLYVLPLLFNANDSFFIVYLTHFSSWCTLLQPLLYNSNDKKGLQGIKRFLCVSSLSGKVTNMIYTQKNIYIYCTANENRASLYILCNVAALLSIWTTSILKRCNIRCEWW